MLFNQMSHVFRQEDFAFQEVVLTYVSQNVFELKHSQKEVSYRKHIPTQKRHNQQTSFWSGSLDCPCRTCKDCVFLWWVPKSELPYQIGPCCRRCTRAPVSAVYSSGSRCFVHQPLGWLGSMGSLFEWTLAFVCHSVSFVWHLRLNWWH